MSSDAYARLAQRLPRPHRGLPRHRSAPPPLATEYPTAPARSRRRPALERHSVPPALEAPRHAPLPVQLGAGGEAAEHDALAEQRRWLAA